MYEEIVRTQLANERTFLAYIRTALTFLVAGASLIQFFDSRPFVLLGWVLMPLGVLVFLFGAWRCWLRRHMLRPPAQ